MRRFGGDSGIIGRGVTISGRLRTVIGVMPATVRFPDAPVGFLGERGELWVPNAWENNRGEERGNQYLGFLARRRAVRDARAGARRPRDHLGALQVRVSGPLQHDHGLVGTRRASPA